MDDFETRLEIELAHMLDPIVEAPVPRRRRHANLRAVEGGLLGARPELTVVREPVPVAASVASPL